MNDLDKRIAELKGITYREHDKYNYIHEKECSATSWNSDAKALELVDELIAPSNSRLGRFYFSMFYATPGDRILESDEPWQVCFTHSTRAGDRGLIVGKGKADARPEAICRAYIAARERMATKEGA